MPREPLNIPPIPESMKPRRPSRLGDPNWKPPQGDVVTVKPTLDRLLEVGPVFCNQCMPEQLKGRQYRSGWVDTFCSLCQAITSHSAYSADVRDAMPSGY